MKKRYSDLTLIVILVVISLALYVAHLIIFKDIEHVTIFGLSDLAFMPIEVIFVTLNIPQGPLQAMRKRRR